LGLEGDEREAGGLTFIERVPDGYVLVVAADDEFGVVYIVVDDSWISPLSQISRGFWQ
jgi:hypothetical protein